ncbi:phenylacetic acid degradation-like protein [Alcanivorax balearicus MACL04]|uniref:Phenylacetic acid degradation-like protein n=1 Tax=Alloalcanivorax balearicus MACL04 TaxID=1177182 RepID=A0ABT2QZE2_9GAMM|nr:TerB family tellurite resistance protein [Alloalcanivorax balearicus]MCU5782871.1 phenylacetic acid degradation-like protein [Alloalcanivorax balearicus MACL04]
MHIVLGLLGTLVTILWLLYRLAEMGIDLGGLNPWAWRRRRQWRSRSQGNPIYALESPLEVTALLMTAAAKLDGDMSGEEKRTLLTLFRETFHLSEAEASDLLTACVHLFGKGEEIRDNLAAVVRPCLDRFSPEQAESALDLVERIIQLEGNPSQRQRDLLEQLQKLLRPAPPEKGQWQ